MNALLSIRCVIRRAGTLAGVLSIVFLAGCAGGPREWMSHLPFSKERALAKKTPPADPFRDSDADRLASADSRNREPSAERSTLSERFHRNRVATAATGTPQQVGREAGTIGRTAGLDAGRHSQSSPSIFDRRTKRAADRDELIIRPAPRNPFEDLEITQVAVDRPAPFPTVPETGRAVARRGTGAIAAKPKNPVHSAGNVETVVVASSKAETQRPASTIGSETTAPVQPDIKILPRTGAGDGGSAGGVERVDLERNAEREPQTGASVVQVSTTRVADPSPEPQWRAIAPLPAPADDQTNFASTPPAETPAPLPSPFAGVDSGTPRILPASSPKSFRGSPLTERTVERPVATARAAADEPAASGTAVSTWPRWPLVIAGGLAMIVLWLRSRRRQTAAGA